MTEVISVWVPQETVNDDFVLVQKWQVEDGQAVQLGQVLVEVETSKSVFEITCPTDGVVRLNTRSNQEVPIGHVLCFVGSNLESIDQRIKELNAGSGSPLPSAAQAPPTPNARCNTGRDLLRNDKERALPSDLLSQSETLDENKVLPPATTRFSLRALARLTQLGLSPNEFTGRGLLRERDLFADRSIPAETPDTLVTQKRVPASGSAIEFSWKSSVGVPYQTQGLPRSKRLETRILSWSSQQAIRSSVSVVVPTHGRETWRRLSPEYPDSILAYLILSTASLLREFPLLNACCLGDEMRVYEQINVGYALDAGHGLKVPVIRSAEASSVEQIVAQRNALIEKYLTQTLLASDLAGATFTITDLAGVGVFTFDPLISEGQAAILGIGGDFDLGGRGFQLILSFDHRLADGRMASTFLNQLKDRIVAYEQTLYQRHKADFGAAEPRCTRCGMKVLDATRRNHFLVTVADANSSTRWVCTVCLQGR